MHLTSRATIKEATKTNTKQTKNTIKTRKTETKT